jgi:HEAT repeat protein
VEPPKVKKTVQWAELLEANDIEGTLEALRSLPEGRNQPPEFLYGDLVKKAKTGRLTDQYFAVTILGRLPKRDQVGVIVEVAQKNSDLTLRCQAMYSLGVLRDRAAVPYLLEVLGGTSSEKDRYDQWVAAEAIQLIKKGIIDRAPIYVQWFVFKPLTDSERLDYERRGLKRPSLEEQYAEYLAWWTGKPVVRPPKPPAKPSPELSEGLARAIENNDIQATLEQSLDQRGNPRLYRTLEAKVLSINEAEQLFAVTVLGQLPDCSQSLVIEKVARNSKSPELRCQAIYSLGVLGDPSAAWLLLDVLEGKKSGGDLQQRRLAALALGLIRNGCNETLPLSVRDVILQGGDDQDGHNRDLSSLDDQFKDYSKWWSENVGSLFWRHGDVPDYHEMP